MLSEQDILTWCTQSYWYQNSEIQGRDPDLFSDKEELVNGREALEWLNKKNIEYDKLKDTYKLIKEDKEITQKEIKTL